MKSDDHLVMWACGSCDKKFKYESEKKRHEQSHDPQFECRMCSKKFSFLSALRRHEKQHDRHGSVQCSRCGGSFRDDTLLKRHMQYAHKGTFNCMKCAATFNSKQALNTHIKTHKPEAERRFHCSFVGCLKTFNFPHHLKHHELTHKEDKPFFCSVCKKGFIQAHHLKIHLKTHEPDSWLPCPVENCKKKFTNEYSRKRHLATHKNKSDSGISSDSSTACETMGPILTKDSILCASCGQLVKRRLYDKHTRVCVPIAASMKSEDLCCTSLNISEVLKNNEIKTKRICDKFKKDSSSEVFNLVTIEPNCKSVIGECIANNKKNICNQMLTNVDELYSDLMMPNNMEAKMPDLKKPFDNARENDETVSKGCKSCDCSSKCPRIEIEIPTLNYKTDGTIKIMDVFDFDIEDNNNFVEKYGDDNSASEIVKVKSNDFKSSFTSCKDVLGNCIVSGNGTMGEGCLCAKMTADDDQMIAQEIEDITPCPKNAWLNL